jgi:hypothetical protein
MFIRWISFGWLDITRLDDIIHPLVNVWRRDSKNISTILDILFTLSVEIRYAFKSFHLILSEFRVVLIHHPIIECRSSGRITTRLTVLAASLAVGFIRLLWLKQ